MSNTLTINQYFLHIQHSDKNIFFISKLNLKKKETIWVKYRILKLLLYRKQNKKYNLVYIINGIYNINIYNII